MTISIEAMSLPCLDLKLLEAVLAEIIREFIKLFAHFFSLPLLLHFHLSLNAPGALHSSKERQFFSRNRRESQHKHKRKTLLNLPS